MTTQAEFDKQLDEIGDSFIAKMKDAHDWYLNHLNALEINDLKASIPDHVLQACLMRHANRINAAVKEMEGRK